ncbi:MAG: hypothetical protein ACI8YP_003306 [Algoriphagus sp.]|jgi:hypothetical protein
MVCFLLLACEKEEPTIRNEFRVVVESTSDLACYLPVIRFLEKDARVKEQTDLDTLTYNAVSLDEALNKVGNLLIIEFRKLKYEELRICNTFGIPIPGVLIVNARLAD